MDSLFSAFAAEESERDRQLSDVRNRVYEALYDFSPFIEWLNSRDELGSIGRAGRSKAEPLAQFLQSRIGQECEISGDASIRVQSSIGIAQEITLTRWAIRYLKLITQNGAKYGDPVTAKDCLTALQDI